MNAASMPSRIFWPSSLFAPLNGADIPNRISLSEIPRTITFGPEGSWPSGCAGVDRESCCPPEDACATVVGAVCATAAGCAAAGAGWATGAGTGAATEADAVRVGEPVDLLEDALPAVRRSVDLDDPNSRDVASTSACAPCDIGRAKMSTSATTAAKVTTSATRPIKAEGPSSRRWGGGGGSGTGSGQDGKSEAARLSVLGVLGAGTVGAEGTYGRSVEAGGCSRNRLGANLL